MLPKKTPMALPRLEIVPTSSSYSGVDGLPFQPEDETRTRVVSLPRLMSNQVLLESTEDGRETKYRYVVQESSLPFDRLQQVLKVGLTIPEARLALLEAERQR